VTRLSLLLAAGCFCSASWADCNPKASIVGTYEMGKEKSGQHNVLAIRRVPNDSNILQFQLETSRTWYYGSKLQAPAANLGSFSGRIQKDVCVGRASPAQDDEPACELTFRFASKGKVAIEENGKCFYGNGAFAFGSYRRTSAKVKDWQER
jgi:hypothetical protein